MPPYEERHISPREHFMRKMQPIADILTGKAGNRASRRQSNHKWRTKINGHNRSANKVALKEREMQREASGRPPVPRSRFRRNTRRENGQNNNQR